MSIRRCQLTRGPNFCLVRLLLLLLLIILFLIVILLFLFLVLSVAGVKKGIAGTGCPRTTTHHRISYVCAGPIDLGFSSIASR